MKIGFIQITDIHCKSKRSFNQTKIEKLVSAVKSIEKVDNLVLIITGDLADTADVNEFKVAKSIVGKLLHDLSKEMNCGFIRTLIVPGNHDIKLAKDSRSAETIRSWGKEKNKHLADEIRLLNNFYSYANQKGCFLDDKLCDVSYETFGDVTVQYCLVNSAPFSVRNGGDKELHFLPSNIEEKLGRDESADFKITIMHHHHEWFDWETREIIKRAISSDDITFYGHDHISETISTTSSTGNDHQIMMGGKFDLNINEDAFFNCVIYDSESRTIKKYEAAWLKEEALFAPELTEEIRQKEVGLLPKTSFIDQLLEDNQGICTLLTDYFVMPKLDVEGDSFGEDAIRCENEEDLFNLLEEQKAINITGQSGAGKSALAKHLYAESTKRGYHPLFVTKRDYNNDIDKMCKRLFEEQYPIIGERSYNKYLQADENAKIIFIDDLDLIKGNKAREKLISEIIQSGKLLIYTTKEKNLNIEEIVKNKLQEINPCTINILPFYKESRDLLIENVGKIYNKSGEEIETVKNSFDYFVQSQTGMFSFTPSNMLEYVKYFMRGYAGGEKGGHTISMVFETNIRNSLIECAGSSDANKYLILLEYVADKMYFENRSESIGIEELGAIVDEHNSKRRADINPKKFLKKCIEANIMKESDDSFEIKFYNKNIFAYFIAKAINRQVERQLAVGFDKLDHVVDYICFGINDTIILFLSFIRSNIGIITNIAEKAISIMEEYDEWSFEDKNIPFIHQNIKIVETPPSAKDTKETHKQIEQIEKEHHDIIEFQSIFDYNEDDAKELEFVTARALKYTRLIGRAVIDQFGALELDELDILLQTIFSVPQRIIYALLKPCQDNYQEIVDGILKLAEKVIPEQKIQKEAVEELLGNEGTMLALNVLNDIAFSVSNDSTIVALRDVPENNRNYKVLELMMEENVGRTSEFVERAIKLRKDFENSPYGKILINQIARKHLLYTSNVDHREIDRLISGKVISPRSKPELLLSAGTKNKH